MVNNNENSDSLKEKLEIQQKESKELTSENRARNEATELNDQNKQGRKLFRRRGKGGKRFGQRKGPVGKRLGKRKGSFLGRLGKRIKGSFGKVFKKIKGLFKRKHKRKPP